VVLASLIAAVPATAASYRDIVLSDSPRAYWRLGEQSGTFAQDQRGAHPGTYTNGPLLRQPGALSADPDSAVRFDGINDYLRVPDAAGLDFTDTFTLEAWVKRSSTGGVRAIIDKGEQSYSFRLSTSGYLLLRRNAVGTVTTATRAITDTTAWHHVMAVKSATTARLYLDGQDVTGPVTGQTMANTTVPLSIGASDGGIAYHLPGILDEVAVYPSALTAARAQAHFQAALATPPPDSTPPAVTLTSPPDGSSGADSTPTFAGAAGTATGDSDQVTVKLYAGTQASGTPVQTRTTTSSGSSWSVDASPALADGTYTARAEQSDAAGNTGLSSPRTFTVETPAPSSYRETVLSDSPRAYWRLGEQSGPFAQDERGSHVGTYTNGPLLGQPGALSADTNGAARFDGTNDYVRVPDAAELDFTDTFTLEAWVKRSSTGGVRAIVDKGEQSYSFRLSNSGFLLLRRNAVGTVTTSTQAITDTTGWHHVAAVKSGTTAKLYLDGQDVTGPVSDQTMADTTAPLSIGASDGGIAYHLPGALDEVAVYDSALSAARVQAHYDVARPLDTTTPLVTLASPAGGSTMDAQPTFGGAAGRAPGDAANVSVKVYSGPTAMGSPVLTLTGGLQSGGSFSAKALTALTAGTYTARAEQSDAAGNTGLSAPRTFTVDPALPPQLLAAGDIARCDTSGDEATAALLDRLPGTVAPLGDTAYYDGSATAFANCYDPSWGRHQARSRPVLGNHEYDTGSAQPYFDFFGAAGDPDKGYYSYDLGSWHVIALNTECGKIGGCEAGSPQEQWLRQDLAASTASCTVAYFHRPRFSSGGEHGGQLQSADLWRALHDAGADVVISADDHNYERFAPQDPDGNADVLRGIREFVVGTGGGEHVPTGTPQPNSEVREADTWGVLRLAMRSGSYDWEFVAEAGGSFTDSGSGNCH
jgi:archaeosine-15-forming tRNA-guanine transglycosylase